MLNFPLRLKRIADITRRSETILLRFVVVAKGQKECAQTSEKETLIISSMN